MNRVNYISPWDRSTLAVEFKLSLTRLTISVCFRNKALTLRCPVELVQQDLSSAGVQSLTRAAHARMVDGSDKACIKYIGQH